MGNWTREPPGSDGIYWWISRSFWMDEWNRPIAVRFAKGEELEGLKEYRWSQSIEQPEPPKPPEKDE